MTSKQMIMKALAVALLLFLPTTLTAKGRQWKDATVAAITEGSPSADPSAWLGIKIEQNCLGYRVEVEDTIYILEYCPTPPDQHFWSHGHYSLPNLTANAKTKIAIDTHEAYILDAAGKKFKTTIMETAARSRIGQQTREEVLSRDSFDV
jgi:hypothetical protein